MSFLTDTITVEKIIDNALLNFWYADAWNTMKNMNSETREEQAEAFTKQAETILRMLVSLKFGPAPPEEFKFKSIKVMVNSMLIGSLEARREEFKHPEDP